MAVQRQAMLTKRAGNKKPPEGGSLLQHVFSRLDRCDVLCLRALLAIGDRHGHFLPFVERAASGALNRAEVHKNVFASLALNEPPSLLVIEPLNGTFNLL